VLLKGDCRQQLVTLPDNSIDSIVTDPPYELGFMGKTWDSTGIAYNTEVWQQCLRVLKPGGHLLAFGGSRTYHRLACAIEDAGFQIRDQIMWVYGSGFPKSLNISKAIDKSAGAEREVLSSVFRGEKAGTSAGIMGKSKPRTDISTAPATADAKQWEGWGTALKPAHEPIVLARKPLDGTVANNVLTHGLGGINIDGCRVDFVSDDDREESTAKNQHQNFGTEPMTNNTVYGDYSMMKPTNYNPPGRFPANFIHDGSDEVLELFPDTASTGNGTRQGHRSGGGNGVSVGLAGTKYAADGYADGGSAARFFYCAKANKTDRNEGLEQFPLVKGGSMHGAETRPDKPTNHPIRANHHPTVKPTTLMRYLCRLVTPPHGTILDPFTGSGSTGKAAVLEGFNFIGIELDPDYIAIAEARIQHAYNQRH